MEVALQVPDSPVKVSIAMRTCYDGDLSLPLSPSLSLSLSPPAAALSLSLPPTPCPSPSLGAHPQD